MVSFCREVMNPCSRGCMFRTALQLSSWSKLLVKEVEEVDGGSTSRLDLKRASCEKKEAVFIVESVSLH